MCTRYAGGSPQPFNPVRFLSADLANETHQFQSSRTSVINLLILKFGAMFATIVSIAIAMYAGWYRGGLTVERAMSISIGCVAVLYVHMLPALRQALAGLARLFAFVLWAVGLIVVLYGQVTFVLVSRQHAGDQRVAMAPAITQPFLRVTSPGRTLTEIARETSKAKVDLARVEARSCVGDCRWLKVSRTILETHLATLETEAGEARRHEAEEDRHNRLVDQEAASRAALRADPVASEVATWLGTTEGRLELLLALACSVVLEGAAITGWMLVSVRSSRANSRAAVMAGRIDESLEQRAVVQESGVATGDHPPLVADRDVMSAAGVTTADDTATDSECVGDDFRLLREIHKAVVAGRLRPTQAAIRSFMKCGQSKASRLKREYFVQFGGQLQHGGRANAH
ncbi:hypothetical protein [Burkholderia pseudomallei]|uniref:hypothetical protein n=1 Tax=Burkholderia pseudomallei TaxID=28450 RepID=UPI00050DCCBF|nr:hypothetical protein [Burkholderia pseudomallei]KGD48959.1 hypothetical protein DP43_2297 [Burkholderia pseudomallei]KGU64341.1 hypothetical protein Y037_577 [Burkholderia pseudomallei MSHR983]